jgi:hypothetical protein
MALMIAIVGFGQSWNVALAIVNLCLISAVMSMGLNMQWGFAGLFNAGVMASTAIGGLTALLISYAPVSKAWSVGGTSLFAALISLLLTIVAGVLVWKKTAKGKKRSWRMTAVVLTGYLFLRFFYEQGTAAIEAVDPAKTGFLGGMGAADYSFMVCRWTGCSGFSLAHWKKSHLDCALIILQLRHSAFQKS